MRHRLYTLAIAVGILLTSCSKTDNSNSTSNPQPQKEDTTFMIGGLKDIYFSQPIATEEVYLSIAPTTTSQPRITLSADNKPNGINIDFSPQSGIIPYSSKMSISNKFALSGSYEITVHGTNENGLIRSFKIKINTPCFTCVQKLLALQEQLSVKYANGQSITTTSIKAGPQSSIVLGVVLVETRGQGMGQYSLFVSDVTAVMDCNNNTISIPEKNYMYNSPEGNLTYKISGSGTVNFDTKNIEIFCTIINPEGNTIKTVIKGTLK